MCELPSSENAIKIQPRFTQMIDNGTNPIETDPEFERASVAALSDENINNPMHSTPSENSLENYENDANVMETIAKTEIKEMVAEESNRNYAERTQAKVQTKIEKTLVDTIQLNNSAASNGTKTGSARFLEMIVMGFFSC